MNLIFEISSAGHGTDRLPPCDVPSYTLKTPLRSIPAPLPEVAEVDLDRHYTALAKRVHGVNSGFYPLGSCTMKYNPAVNEEAAGLAGFTRTHPLQPNHTVQGTLQVLAEAESILCEITGMDAMTFQPGAGAHGEFTGLLLIKSYHASRGDTARRKVLVPDAAHGTNPATASMCGMEIVSLPSNKDGCVNLDLLRAAAGSDTAGLMLTNPNTLGIFDKNICQITQIVHEAGGLCYYDGANLNAVMGIVRPGDMGFDVIHLNLHKTFSTPHGGGGPGSGPVGCKAALAPFLPKDRVIFAEETGKYAFEQPPQSIGRVKAFYGNFLVVVKALTYLKTVGAQGIREAACNAVLNANYFKHLLAEKYDVAYDGVCMHEFVLTLARIKKETGVSALDVAKELIDHGIHPPTMYFPLIVEEALMAEPTETESKRTLDEAAKVFLEIYEMAYTDPARLSRAPITTPVRRPDEVSAARHPKLRYPIR